jgi:hypothetical protein
MKTYEIWTLGWLDVRERGSHAVLPLHRGGFAWKFDALIASYEIRIGWGGGGRWVFGFLKRGLLPVRFGDW